MSSHMRVNAPRRAAIWGNLLWQMQLKPFHGICKKKGGERLCFPYESRLFVLLVAVLGSESDLGSSCSSVLFC